MSVSNFQKFNRIFAVDGRFHCHMEAGSPPSNVPNLSNLQQPTHFPPLGRYPLLSLSVSDPVSSVSLHQVHCYWYTCRIACCLCFLKTMGKCSAGDGANLVRYNILPGLLSTFESLHWQNFIFCIWYRMKRISLKGQTYATECNRGLSSMP